MSGNHLQRSPENSWVVVYCINSAADRVEELENPLRESESEVSSTCLKTLSEDLQIFSEADLLFLSMSSVEETFLNTTHVCWPLQDCAPCTPAAPLYKGQLHLLTHPACPSLRICYHPSQHSSHVSTFPSIAVHQGKCSETATLQMHIDPISGVCSPSCNR